MADARRRPSDELVAATEANACPHCVPVVHFAQPVGDRWLVEIRHREKCPINIAAAADGAADPAWADDVEARMAALGYRVGAVVPDYVPDTLDSP
jgi:hypothetical protein